MTEPTREVELKRKVKRKVEQGQRGIRRTRDGGQRRQHESSPTTMPSERTSRKKFRGPFAASSNEAKKAAKEYERHKFASVLAQIDLALCF